MTLAALGLPKITFHRAAHYTEGRTEPVRAFVNHRMVGTLAGTTAYFTNPATRNVSTHFGVGKVAGELQIHQYVPLDDTAYGNGNFDPSGSWDNWGFKTTEVNAQTINIEHQDHWGDPERKGIVPREAQEASAKLQALIRYGTLAQWKAAGIRVRDWERNGPILVKELRAVPIDGRHVITHHDIAGKLKPYCWLPWAKDTIGFPRSAYVAEIRALALVLAAPPVVPEPPVPEPPEPPPPTYTQEELDAAVAAAIAATAAERDELAGRIVEAKDVLEGEAP